MWRRNLIWLLRRALAFQHSTSPHALKVYVCLRTCNNSLLVINKRLRKYPAHQVAVVEPRGGACRSVGDREARLAPPLVPTVASPPYTGTFTCCIEGRGLMKRVGASSSRIADAEAKFKIVSSQLSATKQSGGRP